MRTEQTAPGFNEYQARLFLAQKRRQPIAEVLVASFMFGILHKAAPIEIAVGWLLLSFSVQTFYFFLPRWLVDRTASPPRFRLESVPPFSLLNGLVVALPMILFPKMAPLEQALLTMTYIALSVGSIASTATFRPVFLMYSLPLLLPLPVLWLTAPGFDDPWIQRIVATMLIVFTYVVVRLSKDMSVTLHESFVIRHEREELNRELKIALQDAEAANRAKTRFLASASHDLRQPIQTLSLFAAALAMRKLDDRSQRIVANLNEALRDLSTELDALLDVSKLDAGVIQMQPSPIRLRSLLDRIATLFGSSAQDKHLELRISCAEDAWTYADRNHLERILRNLVENAIKYTASGHVSIDVNREDGVHLLCVSDTGCGIAEVEQSRVFDEFYQIDNPQRDRRRGLGLGLSIVKRLTRLMGIALHLESTVGSGSRFLLKLPVAEAVAASPVALPRQITAERLHILAVDDEERVRLGMQALIEELGWSIDLGASLEEAVAAAKLRRPDVLLTDYRLAGADDGIAVIRAVRSMYPDLPALIVSGDSAPERLVQAREAGVSIVHKPVSADVLTREIARVREG